MFIFRTMIAYGLYIITKVSEYGGYDLEFLKPMSHIQKICLSDLKAPSSFDFLIESVHI